MKADLVVKNGHVVTPREIFEGGVAIAGGKIVAVGAATRCRLHLRLLRRRNLRAVDAQVNAGRLTLNQYVKVSSENPARVWQMYPKKRSLNVVSDGDVTIVDMNKEATINPRKLHSKNVPTRWDGWKVEGVPTCTIVRCNMQMRAGESAGKVVGQMQTPATYC
jgi:dihydroorotase-like cyclic amidohydrolase